MQNSKVVTIIVCALTVVMGLFIAAAGLGAWPMGPSDPTVPVIQQRAVTICIGVVFAAGGVAAILTTVPGRAALAVKNLLALIVVVGLTALLGWVALGPGSRGFGSPMEIFGSEVNEVSGRVMFALGALLGLLILGFMVRDIVRRARSPKT